MEDLLKAQYSLGFTVVLKSYWKQSFAFRKLCTRSPCQLEQSNVLTLLEVASLIFSKLLEHDMLRVFLIFS